MTTPHRFLAWWNGGDQTFFGTAEELRAEYAPPNNLFDNSVWSSPGHADLSSLHEVLIVIDLGQIWVCDNCSILLVPDEAAPLLARATFLLEDNEDLDLTEFVNHGFDLALAEGWAWEQDEWFADWSLKATPLEIAREASLRLTQAVCVGCGHRVAVSRAEVVADYHYCTVCGEEDGQLVPVQQYAPVRKPRFFFTAEEVSNIEDEDGVPEGAMWAVDFDVILAKLSDVSCTGRPDQLPPIKTPASKEDPYDQWYRGAVCALGTALAECADEGVIRRAFSALGLERGNLTKTEDEGGYGDFDRTKLLQCFSGATEDPS